MSRLPVIAILAVSIAAPGWSWAQSGSINDSDKAFLMKDSRGAAYELQAAKLAATKAAHANVKDYAEKLVMDHEKYNAELEQLGKSVGLTLPATPDPADVAHLEELRRSSGTAFDALFVKEAQRVNAEDKRDAEMEKASTDNAMIKSFIAKFADTDAEHEKIADRLAASRS